MKHMILAAQQEDAAKRRLQAVLLREGFVQVPTEEEAQRLRESGEGLVMLRYQLTLTTSGNTAPVETVTMAARPEEIFLHTGGLRMDRVEFGRLAIDYKARAATIEGRELPLTLKEFEVLAYLAYHKNLVLTRGSFWRRSGRWITTGTSAPWTATSNACGRSWGNTPGAW